MSPDFSRLVPQDLFDALTTVVKLRNADIQNVKVDSLQTVNSKQIQFLAPHNLYSAFNFLLCYIVVRIQHARVYRTDV